MQAPNDHLSHLDAPALQAVASTSTRRSDAEAYEALVTALGGPEAGVWPLLARWRQLGGAYARYADLRHLIAQVKGHQRFVFDTLGVRWRPFNAAAGELNSALRELSTNPDAAVAAAHYLCATMVASCAERAADFGRAAEQGTASSAVVSGDDAATPEALERAGRICAGLAAVWQQREAALDALPPGHCGRCLSDELLFLPIEDPVAVSSMFLGDR